MRADVPATIMRMSLSLVGASMFLTACAGEHAHPPAAQVDSDQGEQRTSIVLAKGPNETADPAASGESSDSSADDPQGSGQGAGSGQGSSAVCAKENMHLLGSCVAWTDGMRFEDGAHCIEHWDGNPNATSIELQYACECAKANWTTQPCSKLVESDSCVMEASVECSRTVVCYPKKAQ
jgi:hypothetical protein